jgi:hypothetical protein
VIHTALSRDRFVTLRKYVANAWLWSLRERDHHHSFLFHIRNARIEIFMSLAAKRATQRDRFDSQSDASAA